MMLRAYVKKKGSMAGESFSMASYMVLLQSACIIMLNSVSTALLMSVCAKRLESTHSA